MPAIPVRIGTTTDDKEKGIYTFTLQDDGTLAPAGVVPAVNPSYLCYSADRTRLYAVLEVGNWEGTGGGAAAAYEVDGLALKLINTQPTGASGPCHISLFNNTAYCANYGGGALSALPIGRAGELLPGKALFFRDVLCAPKGTAVHTHQAQPTPDGRFLCTVDLGMDSVFLHPAADVMNPAAARSVRTPLGCGPRHMVFSADGRMGYLCGEHDNHVMVFRYDGAELTCVQRLGTLPDGFDGTSYTAAIRISPDGRFVLVSNRGYNHISVFPVGPDGLLGAPAWYGCGGDFPRDIAFSPDGRYLLSANQRSDTVTVLRYCAQTGALQLAGTAPVPRPTNVLF